MILLPNEILNMEHHINVENSQKVYRYGIEMEKGAVMSEDRFEKHRNLYEKYFNLWINYPDLFLDFIKPTNSKFKLYFYQRLFLRLAMRYARLFVIAPRAFSKSFISILALILMCIFKPGGKYFIVAPGKAQSAKIAKEKIVEIFNIFPLLEQEIDHSNFGTDYVTLYFKNGSVFDVVSALNSQRGGRRHGGLIDETRDHVADDLNNIVLPLMNVERRTKNGDLNEKEPQQIQLWMSSAGDKNTFCYDKAIEMMELSIINPTHSFIFGCDYRVPMQVGLLPKNFLNEIKTSQTFSEESFAKEYLSRFTGSSSDAWFKYDKILRRRKLINPEKHEIVKAGINSFYIIAVDIARKKCQTAAAILKVYPDSDYRCSLVNMVILGKTEDEKVLDRQAIELKKLIRDFNPREVVIDINGLGIFFADAMIRETFDPITGITYPAYGFFNREEYETIQPRGCEKILFGVKANTQINSDMHSILFSKIDTGKITFLIDEKDAKAKLNSTKVGQNLSPAEKIARLMPHELTSILIDEMMNLKIKPAGANNMIAVEQINERMTKDKFSALEMGTYRISLIETEEMSHRRNRGLSRKLVFYHGGGKR